MAISARTRHVHEAVSYAAYVASPDCQSGLYFDSGGQPGYRAAWLDERVNRESNDFFRDTLATLDEAWLRPRWNGFIPFQEEAAKLVHRCVWRGKDAGETLSEVENLCRRVREEARV